MSLESRGTLAAERSPRRFTVIAVVVGAVSLLGCGSAGKLTCTDDAGCGDGRRCARTVPGESHGVCVANDSLTFRSPVDQALLAAGSVPITVDLTLGSATQPAPPTVDLFVDGQFAQALSLTSKVDRVASYGGVLTLASGQTVSLEVVAARGTLDEVRAGPVRVTGQSTPPPPPSVASAALACQAGALLCARDEAIAVSATVENGPTSVRVSTDLAPGTYYPLTNGGGGTSYSGTIPLAAIPFPTFTASMTATVEALDANSSVVSSKRAGVTVTRLRWAYPAGAAVTSPAVMDDGTLVVGLSQATGQVLAVTPKGAYAWAVTVAAKGPGKSVTSAPAVGKKAIWVGSDDGRLYAVSLTGSGPIANGVCPDASTTATAGHVFTPMVYQLPSASGVVPDEVAFDASGVVNQFFGLAPSAAACKVVAYSRTSSTHMTTAPVMTKEGFAAFLFDNANQYFFYLAVFSASSAPGDLTYVDYYGYDDWVVGVGLDSTGAVLAADHSGNVIKTFHNADATSWSKVWAAVPGNVQYDLETVVVSSADEPIIGGQLFGVGGVDRLTSAGRIVQGWPVSLGAGSSDVTGLALATVDAVGVRMYATTSSGDLFALDQNGAVVWSTHSGSSQLLGTDRLDFPTIAPPVSGQALPTLYAGSADGHLYAVVVDSGLDLTAPWPKAHHDLRNTGNAMPIRP
jgi:outer membrane protein assembly factor BamB